MDFAFFFLISFLEIQRWQPARVFVHGFCSYLLIQKNVSENFQENLFLSSGPEKFPSRLELGMWKGYHSLMEGIPKGYLFLQKMEYIKRVRSWISARRGACETEGWYEAHSLLPCLSNRLFCMGTLFLRLLLETRPSFYVVIRARQRSSHLQGKGSTFISQLF